MIACQGDPNKLWSACYEAFKAEFGDRAPNILEKFRLYQELSGHTTTTVRQRKREFNDHVRSLKHRVSLGISVSAWHTL